MRTSLGNTRRALVEVHENAIDVAVSRKRNEAHGQVDLFAGLDEFEAEEDDVPVRPEFNRRDKLAFERDMLGLYVSDHPLAGLERDLAKLATTSILDLTQAENLEDGSQVTIAGLITSVQHRVARNSGNPYGMIEVEDFGGTMTVMFMGKTYQEFQTQLQGDVIVAVKGRVSKRDDGMNLHAQGLTLPKVSAAEDTGTLTLTIPDTRATEPVVDELGKVLRRHAGESEVRLRLRTPGVIRRFELPHRVRITQDLYGELKALLGPSCLE